jgi:CheY-like chemotaxis protein
VDQERTILVVDDESDVVRALESTLVDQDYTVRQATRWTEAIAEIQDHRPEAVLLDLYLPTVQGEALLEFIRDLDASLPVVIVSAEIDPLKLEQLGRMGANGFVRKPFSEDDLFLVVQQILSEIEAKRPASDDEASILETAAEEVVVPEVLPGAGVERLERDRPEVVATRPTATRRSRTSRSPRRRQGIKPYLLAFLFCLIGTWLLFSARDMLSQGFFGIDIQDTREVE